MPELIPERAKQVAAEALVAADLVHATIKRGPGGTERVTVRPVVIREQPRIQISVYNGKTTDIKNLLPADFPRAADEILTGELRSVHVGLAEQELSIQFTKKGKSILSRKRRAEKVEANLHHDRTVNRAMPEGVPDRFLQSIGMMTAEGKVRADRQRKFQQINEFIRVVTGTANLGSLAEPDLHIIDFGCGNAYLTFALHQYLNQKCEIVTSLTGVDRDGEAIRRNVAKAEELSLDSIQFVQSSIEAFEASRPATIVTALHACDTATDEALAKAVLYGAKLIFASPCCHHHLQAQLANGVATSVFGPMMRDGILRERLGDVVTDTLRALLLRMAGYEVDVIQFAAPEHTAKNLMIRARWTGKPGDATVVAEYLALKEEFQVVPYLEALMPEPVRVLLTSSK